MNAILYLNKILSGIKLNNDGKINKETRDSFNEVFSKLLEEEEINANHIHELVTKY